MPRSTKAGRAVNGTGSIRKTTKKSNGKEYTFWQARYSDPATGLQHSITGKDKKEVTQKLIETLNDINHGCYVAPSKQTLGEWLDTWLDLYVTPSVKPYTTDAYRSACIKTVQSNLGHATASFTLDVYGHASQRMKQQSADRMERYIQDVLNRNNAI